MAFTEFPIATEVSSLKASEGVAALQKAHGMPSVEDVESSIAKTNNVPSDTNAELDALSEAVEVVAQDKFKKRVIWMGIDSLTAGAGGFSYIPQLEKFARGAVGWGGRFITFGNNDANNETTLYKSNVGMVDALDWTDPRKAKSIGGGGFYAEAGANMTYSLALKFDWTHCDICYLQQPTGGTMTISSQVGQDTEIIDTSGTEQAAVYRYTKNLRNGTDSEKNNFKFRSGSQDAEIVVYGAVFYSGDSGPVFVKAAQGGRPLTGQLSLDSGFQQQWFDLLGVTDAIVNAGMNDRNIDTATDFETNLNALCDLFPSNVSQYIVRPNDPFDGISQYQSVYENVASTYGALLDTVAIYGDYTELSDRGWMEDTVHPNGDFYYHWAQYLCVRLFGKARFEETPPVIDFNDGDSQLLRKASFKHVLEVLDAYETRIAALEAV